MLINFTSGVFKSEKEMELYKFRWNEARDKYLDDLQTNGLTRNATKQTNLHRNLSLKILVTSKINSCLPNTRYNVCDISYITLLV